MIISKIYKLVVSRIICMLLIFFTSSNFFIKANINVNIDSLINELSLYDINKVKFDYLLENENKLVVQNPKIKISENFNNLDPRIRYVMFKTINQMMKKNSFPLFSEAVSNLGLNLMTESDRDYNSISFINLPDISWEDLIDEVSFKKDHVSSIDITQTELIKNIDRGIFHGYDYWPELNHHFAMKLAYDDDGKEYEEHADDEKLGIDRYISQRVIASKFYWNQKKIDVVNMVNFCIHNLGKVVLNYLMKTIDLKTSIDLFSKNKNISINYSVLEDELNKAKNNDINFFVNYLALYILFNAGEGTFRLENVKKGEIYDIEDTVFDCGDIIKFPLTKSKCVDSLDALLSYEAIYDDNQYFYELFVAAFGVEIFENKWGNAYRDLLIKVFGKNALGESGNNSKFCLIS